MKIEVQILKDGNTIVKIDISNGRWRYKDDYMGEKIPLTINNIVESMYLSLPVKDAYSYYNRKLYEETGEVKVAKASVRKYNTLLEYLNHRVNNVKEMYKKGTYKLLEYDKEGGKKYHCTIFEDRIIQDKSVMEEVVYKCEGIIEVNIEVVG